MRHCSGQILALALATAHLFAQSRDSVRYTFRHVVVEDSSTIEQVMAYPATALRREELQRFPPTSVGDVLQAMPGVFIRNYGGLGGLKTLSLRGATAAQTTILLEGIRLNSISNGLVDLGQLPIALLGSITIERGSRSALWGANAIGGAVLLQLNRLSRGSQAQASAGAFGTLLASFQTTFEIGRHQLSASAAFQSSRGNYPFQFSQFGSQQRLERINSDAILASNVVQWMIPLEHGRLSALSIVRYSDRGAPGPVLQGSVGNAAARLHDEEALLLTTIQLGSHEKHQWQVRSAMRIFGQHYRDSLARYRGPRGADDRFTAFDAAVVVHPPIISLSDVEVMPFAEVYVNTLRGNLYQLTSGNFAYRLQGGCGIHTRWSQVVDSLGVVTIESAVRADAYNDVPSVVTGMLQVRWLLDEFPIGFRTSLGTSYRPPSFTELYYQNFGSVNLKPERSYSGSTGIVYAGRHFRAEIDGFLMMTHNQIIAVPRSAITWSAQNAGEIFSRGIEASLKWQAHGTCILASGTFQTVTYNTRTSFTYGKYVIYTPAQLGMFQIEQDVFRICSLVVRGYFIGKRFTQTDNAENATLSSVTLFDGAVSVPLVCDRAEVVLRLEVLNIFDVSYELIRNFPMPGRQWLCTVQVKL